MDLKEKLDNLNEGCEKCHVNLCNHCPVGNVKKEIRKKLGIETISPWETFFRAIKTKLSRSTSPKKPK